jgi:hypothetical protein
MTKADIRPMSPAQTEYIRSLVSERLSQFESDNLDDALSTLASIYHVGSFHDMTMTHASAAIKTLKSHPKDPPTTDSSTPAGLAEATRYFDPNRYESRRGQGCLSCGEYVPAGEGYAITGVADSLTNWGLLHKGDCADTTAEQRQAKREQQASEEQTKRDAERNKYVELRTLLQQLSHRVTRQSFRVAIFSTTTDNDLDFLGVYYQQGGKSNRIERHIGSAGTRPRIVRLSLDEQLDFARRIMAFDDDRLARAQESYGRNLHYCGRCGASLTDHESRQLGLGPDCAKMTQRHTV